MNRPHHARLPPTAAGLVLLLTVSCSSGGYDVIVRFEPPELVDQVARVEIALVSSCAGQTLGEPAVGATAMLDVRRMESPAPIGDVPPGTYGLYARGLAADCRVAVAGCSDVAIDAGGSGTLLVTLTAIDGGFCADGETCDDGECIVGPGPDASMDAPDACGDCDDSDPCTVDVCGVMGCRNDPAPDGTTCTDGACYGGACCTGCWDGTTCQPGDQGAACGAAGATCTTCSDTNACTDDGCDATGACVFTTRDADGDGHGDPMCPEAGGVPADDCDETDPAINPTADERCNGIDDDCDSMIDEVTICAPGEMQSCTTSCGSTGNQSCTALCVFEPCVPPAEACNGMDDDCDSLVDEDFACAVGETQTCATSCGSTGTQSCRASCAGFRACVAPAETCNGMDDDCDGSSDEDFTCRRGATRGCALSCGANGVETCGSGCTWGACAYDPEPGDIALWTFDGEPDGATLTDAVGGHDGVVNGGTISWTVGPMNCGDALQIPGVDGPYGEVPDSTDWDISTGRIDLWTRVSGLPAEQGILGRDASGTTLPGHIKILRRASGVLYVRLQTAMGQATRCTVSAIPTGVWLDVSVRFGGVDPELVVDGVVATGCTGSTPQGIAGNANPWVFGADPGNSLEGSALPLEDFFRNGRIDHVRIRDRRASASSPEITGFVLVDAAADVSLGPIADGDVINLSILPTAQFSIRANTDPGNVGSVVFDWDGTADFSVDGGAPYALGNDVAGDYTPVPMGVGMHTVTATAYTGGGGGGTAGAPRTVTFEMR